MSGGDNEFLVIIILITFEVLIDKCEHSVVPLN